MGKRVLVSLLAVTLIFLWAAKTPAQDAGKPESAEPAEPAAKGFQPGKFLTGDDYEHVQAALDCINLKPKDLEYNKVLRDDRLRRIINRFRFNLHETRLHIRGGTLQLSDSIAMSRN